MRPFRVALLVVVVALPCAATLLPLRASGVLREATAPAGQGAGSGYRPGELIVELRAGGGEREIERALRGMGAVRAERGLSGRRYLVSLDASTSVPEAVRALSSVPDVDFAEPNGVVRVLQAQTFTPNDQFFRFQWNLKMIGAERMWAIQKGSPSVAIAVLDTGVAYEDYTDPRTGQVFRRAPDWGSVTFLPGFDFINRDTHPNDDNFHGTHVASIIAEAANNGQGVAGIAFNCALMPVKVLDASGEGTFFAVAEGIDYAVNFTQGGSRPVKVINFSLGSPDAQSETVRRAVGRAVANGVVIVASAGNDNKPVIDFPASLPNVISVGALDQRKLRARYSSYGTTLSLVAPGGDCRRDDDRDGFGDCIYAQTFDPDLAEQGRYDEFDYLGFNGTSQSAPHAAAVAALLISQGITDPTAVRTALESTAEDLGAPGRDDQYGYGLIRPAAALTGMGLNK